MKNSIKKGAFTLLLMLVSLPMLAQTTVFGYWSSEGSKELYLHSTSEIGNFAYQEDKECYGGIAVANEYFEYTEFYIFNDIDGDNKKVTIEYTKIDMDGEKIGEGEIEAVLKDGKIVTYSEDIIGNTIFNNIEPYYEDIDDNSITMEDVVDALIALLVIAALLGSVIHMIYILTRPKHFPHPYTVEDIKQMRIAAGKAAEATDEENKAAYEALEKCFDTWKVFENEEGEEDKVPVNKKMVDATEACVNNCLEIMPTDPELIDAMNEVCDLININWSRAFSGNKMLIWLGIGMILLMVFTAGWIATPFFIFSLALYILSCYKPTFMHNKDAFKTRGTLSAGCLAAIFGFIASAQTVRTVTKWSDGTKTVEDDHSQHWIHLAIGLTILIIIAFLLALWGFINYLRNYVLYW